MATSAADRSPPSSPVGDPFAPGAEVEVLFDDEFHGHWREATVVRFVPARRRDTRRSAPDRYEVSYPHLAEGGRGRGRRRRPARNRVRPRPPRPARFLLRDAVEAFHKNAWRAGLVVSASPSAVTVAFPVTREAIECPRGFLRPRLVYVDGDWVPPSSRAATMGQAQAHLRPANVYKVGDKVEVVVRKGMMWVSATVARVVDDLSYVVEYDGDDLDLEDEDEDDAATEYLHCKFIRPAVERLPLEMFQLDPGAAVEALCDGAWLPAVVRRVVGEDEFEVSIHGNESKPLVTDKVRPQYNWDGEQWTIATPMVIKQRQPNLKQQLMDGKDTSRPIDVASSSDEQSHDSESPTTKKSRKELQQPDVILADDLEHASVFEMDTVFSAPCKLPESNHSPGVSAGDNSELGKKMPSSHRVLPRKVISVKVPVKSDTSKNKGAQTRSIHEPLGGNDASDKINGGSSNTKIHTYETLERSDELSNPLSSSDLTGTVQQRGGKRVARPMNLQPPLALDSTKSHTQQQMERTLEGELHTVSSNQVLLLTVPASSESNLNRKGMHSSSRCTMDNSPVRSCSAGGSSMPSHMVSTRVPSHQVPFAKNSPLWPLIEAWDVFKEVAQQPHFLPLREFLPMLREGMALGMMVSYATIVKSVTEANIEQTVEWFEDHMDALRHLEENGFNVQPLQRTLTKLSQIKSDDAHCIKKIGKLDAEIAGRTSSLSRIDEQLDEMDAAVAELEQKLGHLRQESQKIAREKEEEETQISGLQAERGRLVEARGDAKRQFVNILRMVKGRGGNGSRVMT